MSIRVLSRVWDYYPGKGSDLLAMLALADWSDDEGRCFPSVAALAGKIRLQERQAQRALSGLVEQGFLSVTGNENGGAPGMTRRYKLNLERLTGVVGVAPTGVTHDTPSKVDGCHGRRETGVSGDTQTVIEPSVDISPRSRKASKALPLTDWLAQVAAAGERPIPADDPVRVYAAKVGIPDDLMRLAWVEFKRRYAETGAKTYRDWRQVFRNTVRGNWLKLWFADDQGGYRLTTAGQQAQREMEAEQ